MNKKERLEEMTIKEALSEDIAQVVFKGTVMVDPTPAPILPITPIVIGKKTIKGIKRFLENCNNE